MVVSNAGIPPLVSALFLSSVILTSRFRLPIGAFEGVPLYVAFASILLLYLPMKVLKQAAMFFAALIAYELLKHVQPGFQFSTKGFFGIFALAILVPVTFQCLVVVFNQSEDWVTKWMKYQLFAIFAYTLTEQCLNGIGVDFLRISGAFVRKNDFFGTLALSGFFAEPSHLALGVAPYIFILIYDVKKFLAMYGRKGAAALMLTVLLCPSSTIIMMIIMSAGVFFLYQLRYLKLKYILASLVGFMLVAVLVIHVPNFSSRFFGMFMSPSELVSENQISVLAYLKGFEMALYALQHFPLGVAYLNMEVIAPNSSISYLMPIMQNLNSQDGSSILFKGICEMGVPFIIFCILNIAYFAKKSLVNKPASAKELILIAIYFSFFSHFVRGVSYTYGILTLAIAIGVYHIFFKYDIVDGCLVRRLPRSRQRNPQDGAAIIVSHDG